MQERHVLKWIKSGALGDTLWVSLGITSTLQIDDRLLVVCTTTFDEQDIKLRMDTIYLERFDQAYSCYHGAQSIDVTSTGVELKLNAHGRKSLDFREHLHLSLPKAALRGWKSALKVFVKMQGCHCGEVVKV